MLSPFVLTAQSTSLIDPSASTSTSNRNISTASNNATETMVDNFKKSLFLVEMLRPRFNININSAITIKQPYITLKTMLKR
mmetsp:Transcript_29684/g.50100  ORF Transcript_29684/g.50100 Transcript_29684/m.50100 type:complete len:81 (+) Transcript_29684:2175-2417(+)